MSTILDRRTLLHGGAAAGALALLGPPAFASSPGGAMAQIPLAGTLATRVLLSPERGATISLAHFLPSGQQTDETSTWVTADELAGPGGAVSSWGQMHRACALAQEMAKSAAAHSWGLKSADCAMQVRRIVAPGHAFSVRYFCWAGIA